MSVALRSKLVNEISATVLRRSSTYAFGDLFTKGEYRINKVHFDKAIVLAIRAGDNELLGELQIIADPNNLVSWPMFKAHMQKWVDGKNARARAWKKDGRSRGTATGITWKYKRRLPSEGGAPVSSPLNMEAAFDKMIKAGVRDFFKKLGKKALIYSHGKSLPSAFGQQPGELNFPTGGKSNPGAKGTVAEGAIVLSTLKVLNGAAGKISRQKGLYDRLLRVVDAKIQDLFGATTKVKKRRTRGQIADSLEYSGELIIDQKLNPGSPDKAIIAEMKRFLQLNQKDFVNEVLKLVKMKKTDAMNLWSGSTNTAEALLAIGRGDLLTKLGKIDKRKSKVTKSGGLDMRVQVNKKLIAEMNKAIKDKSSGTTKLKPRARHSSTTKVIAKAAIGGGVYRAKSKSKVDTLMGENPLALATLINRALPEVVASKMTSPALNYRTGRFAQSAEVKNVTVGPRGGTAIEYTYRKDPYQTFEPGYAMGSTQRDPRKIIGESIRQIAQGIVGNKFLTTRRV